MSEMNQQKHCNGIEKLQLVNPIMAQITALPLDHIDCSTTALRCQGMHLIKDLSIVEPLLWPKDELLTVCIASIFALPSVDTLKSQNPEEVNIQELYDHTMETMETMLKCLLLARPNTTELFELLEYLAPWMFSGQTHERKRAVSTYVSLLKFADAYSGFQMSHGFHRLGRVIGQLCLCLNDPEKEIGYKAMEGMCFLYSLTLHQKDTEMKTDSLKAEHHEMFKVKFGTDDPLQNITRIIKEFGPLLTSKQITMLLLTVISYLMEGNTNTTAASNAITCVILEQYQHKLCHQVSQIVDKIHQQLGSIYQFQGRQIALGVISQLAHNYMAEVCSALLQCPFPMDRFADAMWQAVIKSSSDYGLTTLGNVLLKRLQPSPKVTGDNITPLAVACVFCKLLPLPKCSDVAFNIFPRLLMSLLVQVHYSITHTVIRNSVSQEEFEPVRYLVKALKTLLLAVQCHGEVAIMERERGWQLLTSREDHYRGVGLLARAMIQCSCCDLLRILYLLVPFLERGDEEHQITAMAFFTELLCMSEAKRLPEKYSLSRLKQGLDNENPVIRALCIKGLANMADWPVKEVKLSLPVMTKGLSGMDGKLFVETVAAIVKILSRHEGADFVCNLTLSLQELFSDDREAVRASAILLFGKMVRLANKNNKHLIRHQILENMVPLLLHLQEENPDITKNCKSTLDECFHFLGWKLPKQMISGKVWHEHEEILDETCRYLACDIDSYHCVAMEGQACLRLLVNSRVVQKQEGNLQRFLYQALFYTESVLPSIRRASVMFLGFLVLHMDHKAGRPDLDMIIHTLEVLMRDPEASVCIAAAHAHERASVILAKQNTPNATSKTAASDSPENNTRDSTPQNATNPRSNSSSLLGVISLWKSASGA